MSSTTASSATSETPRTPRPPTKRYLHNYGRYSSVHNTPMALWAEKWWRRTIALTTISLVFIVLTALFPLLTVAALIGDAIMWHKRKGLNYFRVLSFFEVYLIVEFIAVISCIVLYFFYYATRIVASDPGRLRWDRICYRYQAWWGGLLLFGWSTKVLGLSPEIHIEGGKDNFIEMFDAPNIRRRIADSLGETPKIMFLRHASFADTLVPQGILSRYFRMRYIVKQELLWDPALDISGSRTPNFFLFRDAGADGMDVEMEAIRGMVKDFKPNSPDVTCIWPEGTRFSESKRSKVLESLKKKNDPKYEYAASLKHTLMPRLGGALALLESNPCGDVIFCSHIGLEATSNFADMLNGKLCNRKIKIRFVQVKHADIPKTKEARIEWMLNQWIDIDNWTERLANWNPDLDFEFLGTFKLHPKHAIMLSLNIGTL
eukprot:gene14504-17118_t